MTMNASDYQKLAARTECNQFQSLICMIDGSPMMPGRSHSMIRINHAVIGAMGELGELAGTVERSVYYGRELDRTNLVEEAGDLLWYMALLCNALGIDMGEVMERNIRKLRVRYPEKYSDYNAAEENRDRAAEREELEAREQTGAGWAEPPEDEDR